MNYDLFILYAREDACFAKSLAKGLERINISVLYKESLGRPGHSGSLKAAIEESFKEAFNGIIVISKSLFEIGYDDKDLNFLCQVLEMENQILHSVWYDTKEADVARWFPVLASIAALQHPPETIDSIARKFQVKMAGSPRLRCNVLTGFHPQIQYIAPRISTYKRSNPSAIQRQLPNERISEKEEPNAPSIDDKSLNEGCEEELERGHPDDEPIASLFDDVLKEEIRKRLDVYLKTLSNWKDLASVFHINSQDEIRKLLNTKQPTLSLLELLTQLDVTIGEFKHACAKIERFDVVDLVNSYLML